MPRQILPIASAIAVIFFIGVWLIVSWQPARQIEKKMDRLLTVAGNRHWGKAEKLISENYLDTWGQDRERALDNASEFGRHFLVLNIKPEENAQIETLGDGTRVWRGGLVFSGRGTSIGEMMFSQIRELNDDFVFAWRRESWKPWDWKLVSAEQPELQWHY